MFGKIKRWQWLVLILVLLAAIYSGVILYWRSHLEIQLNSLTRDDRRKVAQVQESLEETVKGMEAGKTPWRKADYDTIGFPKKEARLLELRQAVDLYNARFGRLPERLFHLAEVFKTWPPSSSTKKEYERLVSDCQIFVLAADSYILNCDGWRPSEPTALSCVVGSFQQQIEKFYLIEKHLVLFVPSFVHGQPLRVHAPEKKD